MTNKGLLVLGGLGLLGAGAYYYSTQKASAAPDTAPGAPPLPPSGSPVRTEAPGKGLPVYVDLGMVDLYTRCYEQGCSEAEYTQIQAYLLSLAQQYPQDAEVWQYFYDELQKKKGSTTWPGNTTSPAGTVYPPQLPSWVPQNLVNEYNACWNTVNSSLYHCDPQIVVNTLSPFINQYALLDPFNANALQSALNALLARYGRSTQGRHTGGCSCQARQEEQGVGACCASCANGEECEECGEHKPTVG